RGPGPGWHFRAPKPAADPCPGRFSSCFVKPSQTHLSAPIALSGAMATCFTRGHALLHGFSASVAGEFGAQRIHHLFGPGPALLDSVETIEEAAVLGDGHAGALAIGKKLDGGDRDRDALAVHAHMVGVDDAVVLDDVLIGDIECEGGAAAFAFGIFTAAFAEIEYLRRLTAAEPALLDGGIGPGAEDAGGAGGIQAFERESAMGNGAVGHAGV